MGPRPVGVVFWCPQPRAAVPHSLTFSNSRNSAQRSAVGHDVAAPLSFSALQDLALPCIFDVAFGARERCSRLGKRRRAAALQEAQNIGSCEPMHRYANHDAATIWQDCPGILSPDLPGRRISLFNPVPQEQRGPSLRSRPENAWDLMEALTHIIDEQAQPMGEEALRPYIHKWRSPSAARLVARRGSAVLGLPTGFWTLGIRSPSTKTCGPERSGPQANCAAIQPSGWSAPL